MTSKGEARVPPAKRAPVGEPGDLDLGPLARSRRDALQEALVATLKDSAFSKLGEEILPVGASIRVLFVVDDEAERPQREQKIDGKASPSLMDSLNDLWDRLNFSGGSGGVSFSKTGDGTVHFSAGWGPNVDVTFKPAPRLPAKPRVTGKKGK